MGGWASDLLSKRGAGGGGWASQTLAGRNEPTPEEPDAEGFKPWTGPAQVPLEQQTEVDARPWLARAQEGAGDAAYAAAGGAFSGLGINPGQAFGDDVRRRLELANERSPWAAGAGQLVGETGIQALAAPAALARAPMAAAAAGGALSGAGNTDSDSWADRAWGAMGGGLLGMGGGYAAGKLAPLLQRGGQSLADLVPGLEREALSQGLMHGGATRADLKRLDDLGGREKFAEGAQRLGLTGRPSKVEAGAERFVDAANAERAALQAAAGPGLMVDDAALAAGVRRSADIYPGIDPTRAAAERAALQAQNIAPAPGQGAPWADVNLQRQYWGNKTNFASGTPENSIRKGIYGAYNDELGDALSLQNPGAGDRWRQLGADEHIALELGDIATAARDRAREGGLGGDAIAAGLGGALGSLLGPSTSAAGAAGSVIAKRALAANRHAIAGGLASGAAQGARGLGAASQGLGTALGMSGPAIGSLAGQYGGENASLGSAALDALHTQPQALGSYASQIAEAAASPDQGAVNRLITRLAHTDPQFQQTVLPLLQRGGGM